VTAVAEEEEMALVAEATEAILLREALHQRSKGTPMA
jgi:hypothetical protein